MALVLGFFGWNLACLSQFLGRNLAYLTLMKYLRENELFCYNLEKILSEKYKYTSLSIEIHHMKDALQTLFSNMNTLSNVTYQLLSGR